MKGVLCDVCSQLEQATGLTFQVKSYKDKPGKQSDTDVGYRTLYVSLKGVTKEKGVTNSILNETFQMYHQVGSDYKTGGSYTIAVVKNRDEMKDYLEQEYDECTVMEFSTPKECLQAVDKGKVDLAFLDVHVAENILIQEEWSDILAIPTTAETLGIAFKFNGADADTLKEVVNKGLKIVDYDDINEKLLQYVIHTSPKMSLHYLINQHMVLFVFVCIALVLIIVFCISIYVYARMMRLERNKEAKINKERTDFFARMSHDLRTPMNGVLGMLELTKDSKDVQEIQANNRKAILSGQYMLSLINDTLDLQSLEGKKLALEPQWILLDDFIDDIQMMFQSSMEQKNLSFIVEDEGVQKDIMIEMDPVRTKQIFVNIISNAVKFTPQNGSITVWIQCKKKTENMVNGIVRVKDTGVGMTKDFVERNLFEPYSQERNQEVSNGTGSGLGMAIVKNLVALMNGSIGVTSEPGLGTEFCVDLSFPWVVSPKEEQTENETCDHRIKTEYHLSGKRILICEDHPMNAEIAQRLLEKVGCEVVGAENGKLGVQVFKDSTVGFFDVILMDIRMPLMDGLEATKEIRKMDREDAKQIPIIAMTANSYDTDKDNCKDAGMNDHISKPFDVEYMYRTIEKYATE